MIRQQFTAGKTAMLAKLTRIVGVSLALVALFTGCGPRAESTSTYAIATGGTGGLYYPIGGAMASIWSNELADVNAKAEVTGGSIVNVIQVARSESDFGFAMADVATDAYTGNGRFEEPLPLRILVNTYPNIVHVLTLRDSGITSMDDIRGKRVSLGAAGSGTANTAENMLGVLGISPTDIAPAYLSFAETTAALKDGTIAAGFIVGGIGLSSVTELAVTRNLHLVALNDTELATLIAAYPAYSSYQVPANTYSGVSQDTAALGIWSAIVVRESMPKKLAFKLVCSLFQHTEALIKVSPAAIDMTASNLYQIASVPLHAGTELYVSALQENGGDTSAVSCID